MAQGSIKKKASGAPKKASQRKQSGNRVIKPKKAALIKHQQMKKKHSSGLAAMTERALAEKAGHLEMLKGGKREKLGKGQDGKVAKSG